MKSGWLYALHRLILRPRQIIITDAHSRRPARTFRLRPVSALSIVTALAILLLLAGARLHGGGTDPQQQATLSHLQHELTRFRDRAAEQEALLTLREQQLAALKEEIGSLKQQQQRVRDRLDMYEAILAARKQQGVHLLQISARRQGEQSLAYSFVLVKGGNYPRTASGKIRFSVISPSGEELALRLPDGEEALPYRTQSHTFLQGTLPWSEPWQAKSLRISVLDRHGKQIEFHDVPIRD